jgi:CRP-like cAMP-binding protein
MRNDDEPRGDEGGRRGKESNRLLAAMPKQEYARLEPHLKLVQLPVKEVLQEPDQRIEYVHFPRSGVISAVKDFDNGDTIEVATIGNEGVAGHSVALDVPIAGNKVFVQVPGEAMRITSSALLEAFKSCPSLYRIILRYSQALFHQVAQTAACNRAHTVDERCARWLLMTHDRVMNASFTITQEFLAQMLGVHRPTVSIAAGMLQKAGMITYVRGTVTILDRKALEEASCECYQLIIKQYQNALGPL